MAELIEKTRGPRARIIEGLAFYGGRAHSQRLRHYGDVPSSTYHFDKLEEQGIIERDGTEYVSHGGEAIVYQLTDFGYDVADELEAPPDADAEMAELKEAIRLLDKKVQALEELESRVDALSEIVGEPDEPDPELESEEPDKQEQPEQPDEPEHREIPDDAPRWVKEAYNDDGTIRDQGNRRPGT